MGWEPRTSTEGYRRVASKGMRSKGCGSIHRQSQGLCDSKILLRGSMNVFQAYIGAALQFGDWLVNSNNNSDMNLLAFLFPRRASCKEGWILPSVMTMIIYSFIIYARHSVPYPRRMDFYKYNYKPTKMLNILWNYISVWKGSARNVLLSSCWTPWTLLKTWSCSWQTFQG